MRYGSQAVVVAIDAKRATDGPTASRSTRAAAARTPARHAVEWAREAAARGAGEILLTSIDRDGTRSGFDCELTAAVSRPCPIPVIASGGAGELDHFVDVFTRGRADAALAASIFHFSEHGVAALKAHLAAGRHPDAHDSRGDGAVISEKDPLPLTLTLSPQAGRGDRFRRFRM